MGTPSGSRRRAWWPALLAALALPAAAGDPRDVVFDCPCSAEWTASQPGTPGRLTLTFGVRSFRPTESGPLRLTRADLQHQQRESPTAQPESTAPSLDPLPALTTPPRQQSTLTFDRPPTSRPIGVALWERVADPPGPVDDDRAWHWSETLALTADVPMDVLGYVRHADGFLTSMHDLAPRAFFNPGGNRAQVSSLRLVNPGPEAALVTITGRDDRGASPGGAVELTIPAGAARTYTAAQLEEGAPDLTGALGDGTGKWRLAIAADRPISAMSLLTSPTGHLTNLSTAPLR